MKHPDCLIVERRYEGFEIRIVARPGSRRPELVATVYSRGTRSEAIREARRTVADAVIDGMLALARGGRS